MQTTLLGALSLALLTVPAIAEGQYDRSIEEAAIRIVAAKMGDIRGGFSVDQRPVFVSAIDRSAPTRLSARRGEWQDGLALASDRRVIRLSSF
ncbi:MAG: hypothetical protein Q8Q62_07115 [Mesorhizobium sp.]|nr:hypothetical protein [Mesorhizobium sp.]